LGNADRKKQILLCVFVAAINIAADRITKLLAVEFLKDKNPIELLNRIIVIGYTENTGAFLSLGRGWPEVLKYILLLYIPIAICLSVFIYCLFVEKDKIRTILLMSIISGGIGNLVDRLLNKFLVIDFLNFGIGSLRTGILNVADLSITFGAITLVIYEIVNNRRKNV
jgi:signal peptidase II